MLQVTLASRSDTPSLAKRPFALAPRVIRPRDVVKKTPLHQMPAAIPEAERPDEPSTIQTTIKSKITPVVSVRTRARRRTLPLVRASAQHDPRRYSPTTFADSLTTFRTKLPTPSHIRR